MVRKTISAKKYILVYFVCSSRATSPALNFAVAVARSARILRTTSSSRPAPVTRWAASFTSASINNKD